MRWNVNSLALLLGVPVLGVCAAALYLFYSKDDDDDIDDPTFNVRTSRATLLEVRIPKASVGVVIGRGGSNIKDIEQRSDTKINVKDDEDETCRTCVIRGSTEAVQLAEAMIHEFITNQPLIETFEMWAPQRALGRIIGHGGTSIREISRSSNSKVSVDRASGTEGQTRIIIKGTSEQIAVAKSLIEEKIEEDEDARKKLELSVANRSPRTKSNKAICGNASKTRNDRSKESTAERLVPVSSDGFLEVYVSAVETPSKFWVQVISPKTVELDHLVDQMTDFYQSEVNRDLHKLTDVKVEQVVAAPFAFDDKWYRALVTGVQVDDYDQGESKLVLSYVDYGDTGYKKANEVCQIRTDFLKLRFQAIECSLAGLKPSGSNWTEEAIDQFEELNHVAQWKPLKAHIVSYKDNDREGSPIPCVNLFDTSGPKDINIGAELVSRGLAVSEEKSDCSTTRDVQVSSQVKESNECVNESNGQLNSTEVLSNSNNSNEKNLLNSLT